MIKKKLFIIIFSILTICAVGQSNKNSVAFYPDSSNNEEVFKLKTQYENLKRANAEIDVLIAVRNKDYRIVCISGFTLLYPGLEPKDKNNTKSGLEDKYDVYLQKYGYKVIRGTSDVIDMSVSGLQKAAYDYAKAYNIALFKYLPN